LCFAIDHDGAATALSGGGTPVLGGGDV